MPRKQQALSALALVLLAGLACAAAELTADEPLLSDLEVAALAAAEPIASCSVEAYGAFGVPANSAAAVGGAYGGYGASAAGYGGYGSTVAGLTAGGYGGYGASTAAAPGGYGSAAAAGYGMASLMQLAEGAAAGPSAAAAYLAAQGCAPLVTEGQLVGIGALANCEGTFTPLAPELSSVLASSSVSDAEGRFAVPASTLGTHTWKAGVSGACMDAVTKLPLAHTWELTVPAYKALAVSDIALLTKPASQGLPAAEQGSQAVFDKVYKAFGLDGDVLKVDVVSWEGVTPKSAATPALLGINAQLAFLAQATAQTVLALMGGPALMRAKAKAAGAPLRAPVLADVRGVPDAIWAVVSSQEGQMDGKALLVSEELIAKVLAEAARLNELPEWSTASEAGQKDLFARVAKVVATSNKEMMQPITDVALACATAAGAGMSDLAPECAPAALATAVASVSSLQRTQRAADVSAAAAAYVDTGSAAATPDTPAGKAAAAQVAEVLASGAAAASVLDSDADHAVALAYGKKLDSGASDHDDGHHGKHASGKHAQHKKKGHHKRVAYETDSAEDDEDAEEYYEGDAVATVHRKHGKKGGKKGHHDKDGAHEEAKEEEHDAEEAKEEKKPHKKHHAGGEHKKKHHKDEEDKEEDKEEEYSADEAEEKEHEDKEGHDEDDEDVYKVPGKAGAGKKPVAKAGEKKGHRSTRVSKAYAKQLAEKEGYSDHGHADRVARKKAKEERRERLKHEREARRGKLGRRHGKHAAAGKYDEEDEEAKYEPKYGAPKYEAEEERHHEQEARRHEWEAKHDEHAAAYYSHKAAQEAKRARYYRAEETQAEAEYEQEREAAEARAWVARREAVYAREQEQREREY